MIKKKSQSSLEFLIIFGIAFIIILTLGGVFMTYFGGEKSSLDKTHITKIGEEMIFNVEKIYFLGSGNRITFDTKFPEGIQNISIVHKNVSDPNNPAERLLFDYLNVSYYSDKLKSDLFFYTTDTYIRFNCTRCTSTVNNKGNYSSYYNDTSDFAAGSKKIRFESKGDWVSIDFVK